MDIALNNSQGWINKTKYFEGKPMLKLILSSAFDNTSIEDKITDLRDQQKEAKEIIGTGIPSADTVMRAIDDVFSEISLFEIQNKIANNLQLVAKELPHFSKKPYKISKITIAIDLHDEDYHGSHIFDDDNHQITMIGSHPDKNGNRRKVFRTGTLAIVKWGRKLIRPITIGFGINYKDQTREEFVELLLSQIDNLDLNIGLLLMDGGFASANIFNNLDNEDLDFISRGKYKKGKKYAGKVNGPGFKYKVARKSTVNAYLVRLTSPDGKQSKALFLSSLKNTNYKIRKKYKLRFRIENTYRGAKRTKIRTNTKKPHIRGFFWAISILIELIWEFIAYIHEMAEVTKYDYRPVNQSNYA